MLRRKPINLLFATTLATFTLLYFSNTAPIWSVFSIIFIWFLITLCGSFFIRWNYHLKALHSNKNTENDHIALTFDDGPHPQFTPKVLALLKKHNAKATFFCIGKQIEKHPDIFKSIIDAGHTVGNHTFSHSKSFGFFNTEHVTAELRATTKLVTKKMGFEMKFYRPAFGVTNPSIAKAVKNLRLNAIGWNVRSLDTTARTDNTVLKRITSKVSKGDIVLLHDTSAKTIRVLERLLLFLEQQKLRSVTVDELLQIKAYA
ncbi:polysaccharide deacetylase family protein [Maribacter sp. 2304DJ31-5]|uniref:polysaccharide deacetylase family protein n=1 Tax=Maribacter sp. 2304DJ31-5 TaxID=3386273 RepID=UPI0039BC5DCC